MRESLTPEIAPHELFSDISIKHASWRNTVVDFVVKNWVKVCATDAWKVVQEKVDADEIPGAAPIMMRLLLAKDGKKCALQWILSSEIDWLTTYVAHIVRTG